MNAITRSVSHLSQRGLKVCSPPYDLQCFSTKIQRRKPNLPWLDKKIPPKSRVAQFVGVNIGELGSKAISLDSVELADKCCRFQDLNGMRLAQSVLDRAIAEKRHFDKKSSGSEQPFPIPPLLFKKVIYGWACLAKQRVVAQVRMREIMDLMIKMAFLAHS